MVKIININKYRRVLAEVPPQYLDEEVQNPAFVDNEIEEPGANLPTISVNDLQNILADNENDQMTLDQRLQIEPEPEEEELPPKKRKRKTKKDLIDEAKLYDKFGSNITAALKWAESNLAVMKILYTTKKGTPLERIVEPHGEFVAKTTGNPIVVTYDRSIKGIRAFIIPQINDYLFTGRRFKLKMRIIP